MLVICGKTCTGKSTILQALIKLGFTPIVTTTTRPPRCGEIDGFDYNFVSDEDFEKLRSMDYFAETTEYNVATGETWKYGTARKDLANNKVIIMNPRGLKKLQKDSSLNIVSCLLLSDVGILWNRLRVRGDSSIEATRRLEADKRDFEDINEYIDFAIRTDGNLDIDNIAKFISETYKKIITKEE